MNNLQWITLICLAIGLLSMVRNQTVQFWPKKWLEDPENNVPKWFRFILQTQGCVNAIFGLTVLPLMFTLTFSTTWQWWMGTIALITKVALGIWTFKRGREENLTNVERNAANILTYIMWAYMLWYILK